MSSKRVLNSSMSLAPIKADDNAAVNRREIKAKSARVKEGVMLIGRCPAGLGRKLEGEGTGFVPPARVCEEGTSAC